MVAVGGLVKTIKNIIKKPTSFFGCDIWKPYIDNAQEKGCYSYLIQCDIRNLPYRSDMFDSVISIQVIEHLEKNSGYEQGFCRISKGKVIICTPRGDTENADLDDNPYQEHHSAYSVKDFRKMGYRVYGYGSRFICGKLYKSGKIPKIIRPIFSAASILSTCITYYFPSLGDHLICVKDKN